MKIALRLNINTVLPIVLAIVLPGLSLFTNTGILLQDSYGFFQSWLIMSTVLYALWYLVWYLWDIKYIGRNKKRIIGLILSILVLIGFVLMVIYRNNGEFEWLTVIRFIFGILLFSTIQYSLRAQKNISNLRLEKEQMQTENLKAQLKALRAQVDPHFLFNSLNTLRSMVRNNHPKAEQFIMSLSDFYRQTLIHNENTNLKLSTELAVLESYLFLMKSRNEEAVQIKIEVDDNVTQLKLPALALQIVVENCFKHNSMTSKNPIFIEIKNTPDHYIEVVNNIQPRIGKEGSMGLGLDILRKKYALLGIENGLLIEKDPEKFMVKLKLLKG